MASSMALSACGLLRRSSHVPRASRPAPAPSPARASTAGAMWSGKFAAIGSASHGRFASRAAISVAKRA